MVVIKIDLSEDQNKKIGIVKSLGGLKSKEEAVKYIIDNYSVSKEAIAHIIGEDYVC
jgi:3-deoxy-D-manno-octulosonate 8-phosphate phosphatase KdsC-like HAD superfamily phosphatase